MLLLIPHLFPEPRLLEAATRGLRLTALETMLVRGHRTSCTNEGTEAALCGALGIERQQDWPIAPIALEADHGNSSHAYWLRADPVHLRLMRDRIVLTDNRALNLSSHEADALANSIGQHFGDALRPLPLHPLRWYLKLPRAPRLTTTPLSVATGRAIEPLLPQGQDALRFRSHLNELQMLLHAHPVNQSRETRGDLPVNSVWLWGGGCRPDPPRKRVVLFARDADAKALGAYCGAQMPPFPAHFDKGLLAPNSVIVLDELSPAGRIGDDFGWRDALKSLEADWFAPMLNTLRRFPPTDSHLLDPIHGKALRLRPIDLWKIWKRPQPLAQSFIE